MIWDFVLICCVLWFRCYLGNKCVFEIDFCKVFKICVVELFVDKNWNWNDIVFLFSYMMLLFIYVIMSKKVLFL